MTESLLQEMMLLARLFLARLSQGHTLTEDEALCYNQTLAMLTRLGRAWELGIEQSNRQEEQKLWREDDDKDDGAGSTAPTTPPTT
jgi:hypothetical protein